MASFRLQIQEGVPRTIIIIIFLLWTLALQKRGSDMKLQINI